MVEPSTPSTKESPEYKFWVREIELSRKRHKKWLKEAERVSAIYEGQRKVENSFNILFSNTETLLPSCFNTLPRPVVERRFKDTDPLAKASSKALERTLAYLMDQPGGEYDPFFSLIEQAVLAALVPGRGVTRFRYHASFTPTSPVGNAPPDQGGGEAEGSLEGDEAGTAEAPGTPVIEQPSERVAYETICGEDIESDRLITGYARRWAEVPWIAFRHDMTEEDAEANFGEELAHQLVYDTPAALTPEGTRKEQDEEGEDNRGSVPTTLVWEIWQKETRRVFFFAPCYAEGLLREIDDPYKLSGFYPIPEPLQFLLRLTSVIPVPLFKLYEEQANELNRITRRLNKVVEAIKVRGFYDGTLTGLNDLLKSDDNTLIPAKNVAAMMQGQTLEKSIWLMPIDELIQVFRELLNGREACKQTIYEITGIADIMRGQGMASETATAQQIKNQWGTLRIKRMQSAVQDYVRGCLRIVGELAGEHFDVSTFAGMSNLDYALPEEVQRAQQTLQLVEQAQLAGPPPGMPGPGAPPGPPPLPPQMAQAAQEAQAVLAKPQWAAVIQLLRDDLKRGYKIDIETNSTIDATSQEDKENITEAMTAIANTMQTFAEPMQSGLFPMPAFKALLLSVARRFEFGREVEDSLNLIPDQPPQQPDPKAEALQMKSQIDQQKAASDERMKQLEMGMEQQRLQADMQAKQQELQFREREMQMELAFKEREQQMDMRFKEMFAMLDMRLKEMQGAMAMRQQAQQGEMKVAAAKQDMAIKAKKAAQAPARPNGGQA